MTIMVSRVGKFVGGLGVDVTNVANVHATENRIALGASINPTANVHVVGNAHVSTTFSTGGNITSGGTVTGTSADFDGGVTIDNITIDGTEIDLSSGDLTVDVAGDITLDAGGSDILLAVAGTNFGSLRNNSSNFRIKSDVSNKDMIFLGNDDGTEITALTLDMSAAGAATFNNNVTAFSDERLKSDITTLKSSLEKVLQMRGVSYTRNDNVEGGEQIGVIAQEVEQFYPQVVLTADDEQGTKSVDYGRLAAVLIEAVKELSELVNRDITSIKKDIDAICQHPLWQENQKKGEWLRFATPMNSMVDVDGVPHLPKLGRALGYFFVETYWSYPKAIFHLHNEFVFKIK